MKVFKFLWREPGVPTIQTDSYTARVKFAGPEHLRSPAAVPVRILEQGRTGGNDDMGRGFQALVSIVLFCNIVSFLA